MANLTNEIVKTDSIYTDDRFNTINNRAKEINALARELNEMSHRKFGELLGGNRSPTTAEDKIEPTCWADIIITEQEIALGIIKDTLERISIV